MMSHRTKIAIILSIRPAFTRRNNLKIDIVAIILSIRPPCIQRKNIIVNRVITRKPNAAAFLFTSQILKDHHLLHSAVDLDTKIKKAQSSPEMQLY